MTYNILLEFIKHPVDRTCDVPFLSEEVSQTWEAETYVCVLWERSIRVSVSP